VCGLSPEYGSVVKNTTATVLIIGSVVFASFLWTFASNRQPTEYADLVLRELMVSDLSVSEITSAAQLSENNTAAPASAAQSFEQTQAEPLIHLRMPDGRIVDAPISGIVKPLPGAIIDFVQFPPPPYSDPMRDGRLESEPVDQRWASRMEPTLWSLASTVGEVKSVQCHTTFCMVTLEHSIAVRTMDLETRRSYIGNKVRYLDEMMRSVTASSNGRLGYHGYTAIGTPDDNFEMRFYVYGPPIGGVDSGQQ
jgi:hypothetical protein